jgi:hypothetical protein
MCKAPYTLSFKLNDFTIWGHTWRKNWVICAVLTGNSAGLRTVFPVVFHTQNCAVHSGNCTVSSVYLPTPRWHHLKSHPFPAIHSANEHHMIYSFSNTTSYSTFYALFSSFRITLWPTWLANSKRQRWFYPPQSHAQEDTQNRPKNLKNLMENLCCAREHSVQFFMQFFYTVKLHSLT